MSSNLLPGIQASASGLTAERTRLEVIASNLANANTTRDINGEAYRKKQVVFESVLMEAGKVAGQPGLHGVKVSKIQDDQGPLTKVYQPSHPHAGPDGMVEFPNVDVATEMVDMMVASRSFEANVQVMQTSKTMFNDTMRIMRQG